MILIVIYTVKGSHFSIILTSLEFSVIKAVIISDSAGSRDSLKCAEGKKKCNLGEDGEGGNGSFER